LNATVKSERRPREWKRAKWLFGGLWIALTVLPTLNALLVPRPTPSYLVLGANTVLAISIAAFMARDIWQLRVRRFPLWVDIMLYVSVIGGLAALIVVKEAGIWVWNDLHLDIPVFLLMGVLALTSFATEWKKRVRVYVGARQLHFVDDSVGL
jgi:hypothetical protein